jgi:hypothetical protein
MGLDGRASFRELKDRTDGNIVSGRRSLANGFSASAHDGQLMVRALRDEETLRGGLGLHIEDEYGYIDRILSG